MTHCFTTGCSRTAPQLDQRKPGNAYIQARRTGQRVQMRLLHEPDRLSPFLTGGMQASTGEACVVVSQAKTGTGDV